MKIENKRVIFLALIALIAGSGFVFPMNAPAAMDEIKATLFVEASWLNLIAFETLFAPDNTVKNTSELLQMFESVGLKPEDEMVTYCTAGIRSAHMALVMRMVG